MSLLIQCDTCKVTAEPSSWSTPNDFPAVWTGVTAPPGWSGVALEAEHTCPRCKEAFAAWLATLADA